MILNGFLCGLVYAKKFGYSRIPASSAILEAEFNNIKCRLFANALPTRADLFVFRHMDYINGRVNLADAQIANMSYEKEENQEKIVEINSDREINLSEIENVSSYMYINTCSVCKSNDEPTDAHSCIVCNKLIHMCNKCLKINDTDEAHGTSVQRICTSCQNIPKKGILNAIDSNEVENWRGLTLKPAKKKSRYLDKSDICLDLEKSKLGNIPILRNESNTDLRPVNIKGKKMSLIQTCSFDSIFQIFLVTLFQSENFKTAVIDLDNKNFFKMISNTSIHGLSKNTYYTKAIILSEIFFEAKETYMMCMTIVFLLIARYQ